jgi:hypothetical protein
MAAKLSCAALAARVWVEATVGGFNHHFRLVVIDIALLGYPPGLHRSGLRTRAWNLTSGSYWKSLILAEGLSYFHGYARVLLVALIRADGSYSQLQVIVYCRVRQCTSQKSVSHA